MKKIACITFSLILSQVLGQTYAPQVGNEGSLGIPADDSQFLSWATEGDLNVGYKNILNQNLGLVSEGNVDNVLGQSNGSIVTLGDNGSITLYFEEGISNGPGFDFAVFENGFLYSGSTVDAFLELAFVEVSSDGNNFFRFPAVTEYNGIAIDGFDAMDARYLHNFAGKYISGYGTPFDLDEVEDNLLLNKNAIYYVRLIDVIGTTDSNFATYDSNNTVVTDPFPTPFESSGFDLDAVGVIHEAELSTNDFLLSKEISIYPNPVVDKLYIPNDFKIYKIFNIDGKVVDYGKKALGYIDVSGLETGSYTLILQNDKEKNSFKFIKK